MLKPTTKLLLQSFAARRKGWLPRYRRMPGEWAKNLRGECAHAMRLDRRRIGHEAARAWEIAALGYRQHQLEIGQATFV